MKRCYLILNEENIIVGICDNFDLPYISPDWTLVDDYQEPEQREGFETIERYVDEKIEVEYVPKKLSEQEIINNLQRRVAELEEK